MNKMAPKPGDGPETQKDGDTETKKDGEKDANKDRATDTQKDEGKTQNKEIEKDKESEKDAKKPEDKDNQRNKGEFVIIDKIDVTELTLDRTTSVPKSVFHLFSRLGSGASIWN